jgi:hypothetical protein
VALRKIYTDHLFKIQRVTKVDEINGDSAGGNSGPSCMYRVGHGAIENVNVVPPLRSHGGDVKWLEMSVEPKK